MRHLSFALATAASIALATPAVAGPTEDLHSLMDDYWVAYLKDNPLVASSTGRQQRRRPSDARARHSGGVAESDGPEQPRGARADAG